MPSRDRIHPEEIRAARESLHLTQQQMANVLDIPLGTYRNWEQGTQGCGNPQLLRFALRCLLEHRSK